MTQYGFFFDMNRCYACQACSIACKDWNEIDSYWENTGTGLDSQSRQYAAAASGLREVSSTATLQSRDNMFGYTITALELLG